MGLLGILITVVVMVAGTGYFLFDFSGGGFTVENQAGISRQTTVTGQSSSAKATDGQAGGSDSQDSEADPLSSGMAVLEKAKEVKNLVEQKATETLDRGTENSQDSKSEITIKDRPVSFGHAESSGRTIDTVVLHSSYNNQGGDRYSVDKVIDIWKGYGVAPHYLIDRKGNIYRLVEDEDIAYHAGNSKMPDGRTNVNKFSIGVEILNSEEDKYTDAQYAAVNDLVAYLKQGHGVKYVVGHDDIAPGRKTDPWNFDWKKLK